MRYRFSVQGKAYKTIESYISEIRNFFNGEADTETTVDIEFAVSDKFERMLVERADKTIVLSDVEQVIRELGAVGMITWQDQEKESSTPKVHEYREGDIVAGKKLFRDPDDKYIAWVSSGIAHYFGIDAWIVRIMFLVALFLPIPSIIPYLILWFFVPLARNKSDMLRMRWIPVSLGSLSSNVESYSNRRILSVATITVLIILTLILALISWAMIFLYHSIKDIKITGYEEIHYEYMCANNQNLSIIYPVLESQEVWIRSEDGVFNLSLDFDESEEEISDFVYIEIDEEIEFLEKIDTYSYESEQYMLMEDVNGREYPILKKESQEIRSECELLSQTQREWSIRNLLSEKAKD